MPTVLATGHLVSLVEWTSIRAVNEDLDAGEQTLGVHVDFSHDTQSHPQKYSSFRLSSQQ